MGKKAADVLFSKTRRDVLGAMLLHPRKSWYLSQLSRHLGAATSHLHRELAALAEAGILNRRVEGRQTYFEANPSSALLPELTGLLRKMIGTPAVLAKALQPLRTKIRCAFIYGSMARGTEETKSDIDLMVLGELGVADLLPGLQRAERTLGRPINPTVYSPGELAKKFNSGHHFIRSVMKDPAKIFILGSAHDLETTARGKATPTASDQQGRARRSARRRRSKA